MKSSAADAADDDEAPLMAVDEDKDEEKDAMDEEWHCMTEPAQPLTNDRSFVQQCSQRMQLLWALDNSQLTLCLLPATPRSGRGR